MHVWPVAANTPAITPLAAASRSASGKTTCADLPPSSRVTRARWLVAPSATSIPVFVEPVKATLSTPGWRTRARPTAGPLPVMTLKTPSGMPASVTSPASSSAVTGVWSLGLVTIVQPAASAGASFQVSSSSGEFQGTMAATTPTGSRRVKATKFGLSDGMLSPVILSAQPAK